jgi:hypothetical protein
MDKKLTKKELIDNLIDRIKLNTTKSINEIDAITIKHKFYIESELKELKAILVANNN